MTSAGTLKMPVAFDTVDRFSSVRSLVTSTSAPGIGRPCSSWTMPVMVPVEMACCADALLPYRAAAPMPPATDVLHAPERRGGVFPAELLLHPWTFLLRLRWLAMPPRLPCRMYLRVRCRIYCSRRFPGRGRAGNRSQTVESAVTGCLVSSSWTRWKMVWVSAVPPNSTGSNVPDPKARSTACFSSRPAR